MCASPLCGWRPVRSGRRTRLRTPQAKPCGWRVALLQQLPRCDGARCQPQQHAHMQALHQVTTSSPQHAARLPPRIAAQRRLEASPPACVAACCALPDRCRGRGAGAGRHTCAREVVPSDGSSPGRHTQALHTSPSAQQARHQHVLGPVAAVCLSDVQKARWQAIGLTERGVVNDTSIVRVGSVVSSRCRRLRRFNSPENWRQGGRVQESGRRQRPAPERGVDRRHGEMVLQVETVCA